jgi:hypothetical protein
MERSVTNEFTPQYVCKKRGNTGVKKGIGQRNMKLEETYVAEFISGRNSLNVPRSQIRSGMNMKLVSNLRVGYTGVTKDHQPRNYASEQVFNDLLFSWYRQHGM